MQPSLRRAASAFLFVLLAGCNGCPRGEHTPVLTKSEVAAIADKAARNAGVDLSKWERPTIRFEFVTPDCYWTAFYEIKGNAMPGHFSVYVHDRTKNAWLAGGL